MSLSKEKIVDFSTDCVSFVNNGKDKQERVTYHVQNRTSTSKKLRAALKKGSNPVFTLLTGKEEKVLAAGLRLPVTIQYTPNEVAVHEGQLSLYADDELVMSIPIVGEPPFSKLSYSPAKLNFGSLICNHQSLTLTFTISNSGTAEGHFSLSSTQLPSMFSVSPLEGTIKPGENENINVTLLCREIGEIHEKLSLLLDSSTSPQFIEIIGNVVQPKLELLDDLTLSPTSSLHLGATYYNTIVHKVVRLYNNSPASMSYVAILNTNCPGSEQGVDMNGTLSMACTVGGLHQHKWREQGDIPVPKDIVKITPNEGTIRPYETLKIDVNFSPVFIPSEQGWEHHQGLPTRRDYALFIQFFPVGLAATNNKQDVAELGLTATALPVELKWQPEEIDFGSCQNGVPYCKTLHISNDSDTLPLDYKIKLPAHYKIDPNKGQIQPIKSCDLTVVFHPKQLGDLKGFLYIEVLGATQNGWGAFDVYKVPLMGKCPSQGNNIAVRESKKRSQKADLSDLASSIRPHDRRVEVKTPYTKVKRHTYTDPDYTYSESETCLVNAHKLKYQKYLQEKREKRLRRETNMKLGNPAYNTTTDIGICPAEGIHPPYLSLESQNMSISSTTEELLTTSKDFIEILDPLIKPCGVSMMEQCQSHLSPQQLSQIIIEPNILSMGDVVRGAQVDQTIKLTNGHCQYVMITLKVVCSSLKFSSSSSDNLSEWQVILPPHSYTTVTVTFSKNELGKYHQSILCLINQHHNVFIPVSANIVSISLELSASHITLLPPSLSTLSHTLEGHVTLHNPHHVPVNFTWDMGDYENYLATTHMEGVVPARSSLICEVYCQGDIPCNSPMIMKLHCNGGESQQLSCSLKYGLSDCTFKESRAFFNPAPQYLPTNKTVNIINKGENHAYFDVIGCHPPVQGLSVSPIRGCIPAGGSTPLTIQLCADIEGHFDSFLNIGLKEGKKLSLRVAGSVEPPQVYIDLDQFKFGSVYCGSKASLPFTIYNKAQAHVELLFDFQSFPDFSLVLPTNKDPYKNKETDLSCSKESDYTYQLIIPSCSTIQCVLEFTPYDVAAYDFILPVFVNGREPIPPPPSHFPPSHSSPQVAVGTKLPTYKNTPKRQVLAVALKAPLKVENSDIHFTISPKNTTKNIISTKAIKLTNTSPIPLTWSLGTTDDATSKHITDGTFKFLFPASQTTFTPPSPATGTPCQREIGYLGPMESFKCLLKFSPGHHGNYNTTVPLYLNGDISRPYRNLHFSGDMTGNKLTTTPIHITIQPVPLGVTVEAEFTVHLTGFTGTIEVSGHLLTTLPTGVEMTIQLGSSYNEKGNSVYLPCILTFSSSMPVSISDCIIFLEKRTGIRKLVPFSVAADNSLLTIYEFFSENLSSVNFQVDSHSIAPSIYLPSPIHTSLSSSHSTLSSSSINRDQTINVTTSTIEYSHLFLQQCNIALCRYISLFGWSNGIRLIRQPQDLMECVGQESLDLKKRYSRASSGSRGPLLDLLRHICGRLPPGISINPTPCHTRTEKVNRHYEELSIVLAFLRTQGTLLWVVVPESLMDWRDYCHWRETNPTIPSILTTITEHDFHEMSERVWTHILAQIIKVLVLPKLLSKEVDSQIVKRENTEDIISSNIYGTHEVLVLRWLNYYFSKEGKRLFGITPRQLQSFDIDLMDCIALACVLVSYIPSLYDSHFSKVYIEPTTPEQVSHNASLLVQAVRSIGINYDIQANDLSAPNPLMLLLFCSHLYHILPQYTLTSTLTLQGPLQSTVTKELKVENTSNKTLVYQVKFLSNDTNSFSIKDNNNFITIPSKTALFISVVFNAKHLFESEAILLLVSKGGGGRQGSPLVFKLVGKVTDVHPMNVVTQEVSLYNSVIIPVTVTNIFNEETIFTIKVIEGEQLQDTMKKIIKQKSGGKKKAPSLLIPSSILKNRSTDTMRLFHTHNSSITLTSNQNGAIDLEYTPLRMRPRQCSIILQSSTHGDLVTLVSTSVTLPSPLLPVSPCLLSTTLVDTKTRTLHMKTVVGEKIQEQLELSSNNELFESAVMRICEWEMDHEEKQRRMKTGSMGYASVLAAMNALNLDSTHKTYWDYLPKDSDNLHFDVSCNSDLFKLPQTVSVPATKRGHAHLPIDFSCDVEGHCLCRIVLHSPHDVRVYCVEVMVMDKGRQAELEIRTPAFQQLIQRIPLANPTTIDWPLQVTLTGCGFAGPTSLIVKALTTGYYPLAYYPRREERVEGELLFINTNDSTEHCFKLSGIGERPLAQENVQITTQAKKRTSHILHVPNTSDRTTVYRVDTDLDFISGPPSLSVTGGDIADYPIMVEPLVRGKFTGAVVFEVVSRSGRVRVPPGSSQEHLWYEIEVIVDPAEPVESYQLTANTFSCNSLEITVNNPFSKPVTLKAIVEGPDLSGPDELHINANSHSLYTLTYSPKKIGKTKGHILFLGRNDGELTMEIELEAVDPKPILLESPQCELGRSAYTTLSLMNPLDTEVTLTYHHTNSPFTVVGLQNGTLTLQPQSSSDVSVLFKPSQLGTSHQTTLLFTSNEFGQQEFNVTGEGLPPSLLSPTVITVPLYQNSIAIISFTNPLSHLAYFDITMTTESDLFCLFLKQTKNIPLKSGVSLDIPVMFAPDTVELSQAYVTITTDDITLDEPLSWVYPVIGQPEILMSLTTISCVTVKAKERVEERMTVVLRQDTGRDLPPADLRPVTPGSKIDDTIVEKLQEKYLYKLVFTDSDLRNMDLFQVSTAVKLIREQRHDQDLELVFDIVFLPPKPFSCQAELHVQPNGYGVWRYPVIFKATDPAPDDIITIQAQQLTGETKKGFRLTSLTNEPLPFKAYLSSSSSPEFSVHPISGVLPPFGDKGVLFTITYHPRTFDKDSSGRLIVETSITDWSYELVGKPVVYCSPSKNPNITAKVDHHQPTSLLLQPQVMTTKNFIRKNIQQLTKTC